MSLTVVATPIGNFEDITLRAVKSLKEAEAIVCEERKPASILLKKLGIAEAPFYQLNEHSRANDLPELVELCRTKKICLVSDCGTPGFCDPGALLVNACYEAGIHVDVNPGPSSLMTLLSITGLDFKKFFFAGFLPAEKSERARAIKDLTAIKSALVIMDTPYRLQATLSELAVDFGGRTAVLGLDLTGDKHQVERGSLQALARKSWPKAPFVLIIA